MRRLVAVILLSLLMFTTMSLAQAQTPSGLFASTNNTSYEPGDKVIITGSVQPVTDENPVTIIVRNPIGNVYEVGQVTLTNNNFVHKFVLSDDAQGGIYTVKIRQDEKTTQIQFRVIIGQTQIIPIFDSEIRVSGKNTSLIKYGGVKVSNADNSITITIDSTKLQNDSIMEEYHVPKRVIDTTGQLEVRENGKSVDCTQTNLDTERILDCPIYEGTNEINMVGTSVIPEFGATTISTMAWGVMVMLLVFSQKR